METKKKEKRTIPAPIDNKNVTTDWICEVFDNGDFVMDDNRIFGFVSRQPAFASWSGNKLKWTIFDADGDKDLLSQAVNMLVSRLDRYKSEDLLEIRGWRPQAFCHIVTQTFFWPDD